MKKHDLKIAVVNFSGNVGKSTIARHLLSPRMPHAPLVAVETINADGMGEVMVKGADFGRLQEELLLQESAIVDVGASNIEQFLSLMRMYRGSHQDFDLFVVPCVPELKQQKDTIECVCALSALGVEASKICVVFNMVNDGSDVAEVFGPLIRFAEAEGKCRVDARAYIPKNELFAWMRGLPSTIQMILDDPRDFKAEIRKTSDPDERLELAKNLAMQRMAKGVQENLDQVFGILIP